MLTTTEKMAEEGSAPDSNAEQTQPLEKPVADFSEHPMTLVLTPSLPDPLKYRTSALRSGGNRLCDLQADITEDNANNGDPDDDPQDGGWDWEVSPGTDHHSTQPSPQNTYGEIGYGLWAAQHSRATDSRFAVALQDVVQGIENRSEVDSPPDFAFLVLLSLTTKQGEMQDLARQRYDAKLQQYGGGTSGLINYIRQVRHSSNADGLIPYDLGHLVFSAWALDFAFPFRGYRQHARQYGAAVAQEIGPQGYFNIEDASEPYYIQGLAWAAMAISWSGADRQQLLVLRNKLLQLQQANGSWYWNADYPQASVQATAAAVQGLALAFPHRLAALWSALRGSQWLAGQQLDTTGGWLSDSGAENSLVTSEVMSALFLVPPLKIPNAQYQFSAETLEHSAAKGKKYSPLAFPVVF
jgi:hypothetical protein